MDCPLPRIGYACDVDCFLRILRFGSECRVLGEHPDEAIDVGRRGDGRPARLQRRDLLERMR